MAQAAPAAVRELVSSAIGDSVTTALGDVLQVAAVIAGIGAVAAFVLVRDAQLYDLSGDER
jgi:hypothetical protein